MIQDLARSQVSTKKTLLVFKAKLSSFQIDARPESDEHVKASFLEHVGFIKSNASTSNRLYDKERDLSKATSVQLAKLKRGKKSTGHGLRGNGDEPTLILFL